MTIPVAKSVELTVTCAPWLRSVTSEHRIKVDFDLSEGPIVRVWDPIANHFTRRHVLTAAVEARIAADADAVES